MVVFKSITWTNFLSTGANPNTIDLNSHKSTLIVGHNGAGKSTLLDALSFVLFGKPHRAVKKGQLVNSVNGKGALVEVIFTTGGQEFKIIRGIKPNKFEIYQNNELIDQSASSRDYQKFLEQNILKLNHKSFHQIVVLGSSSFVPFMQLTSQNRRDVIEDLLDINIFSKMKSLLKERSALVKSNFKDTKLLLDAEKSKIKYQETHVNKLKLLNEEAASNKEDEINRLRKEADVIYDKMYYLGENIEEDSIDKVNKAIEEANNEKSTLTLNMGKIKNEISLLVKAFKLFEENSVCPTCSQSLSKELKMKQQESTKAAATTLNESRSVCEQNLENIGNTLTNLHTDATTLQNTKQSIKSLLTEVNSIERNIKQLNSSSTELTDITDDLLELKRLKNSADELRDLFDKYSEKMIYNDVASEMLKDTGIRTKVIKEYLPAMNMLINQYLQTLDFFVSFNLDENFNETIRSRHRDTFVYANFSEGEKQRIDLALLFAWRKIAQMKNSTNTNLLILDETFDSSLDIDGVDNLMKILYSLDENTNTFVISHKPDLLESKLNRKLEFKKVNNFSALYP